MSPGNQGRSRWGVAASLLGADGVGAAVPTSAALDTAGEVLIEGSWVRGV